MTKKGDLEIEFNEVTSKLPKSLHPYKILEMFLQLAIIRILKRFKSSSSD